MPVIGTPTYYVDAPAISRDDIRMFLRDYEKNNILLGDVQFTDKEFDKALDFAVDEYNTLTPISSDSVASIPKGLLLMGVTSWLMKAESFLQLRNQATYQDADIAPIGIDDKHVLYLQLSRAIKEEWVTTAKAYKQQKNLESVYGSVSSGYRNVGRFYHS